MVLKKSNVRISSTGWILERIAQKKMLRDPAGLPVKNIHARARSHPECAVFRFERRAFGQTCRVALVVQETGGLSIRWVVPGQPSGGGQPDHSAAILIDVSYHSLKHSGRERQMAKALGFWIVLVQRFVRSNPDFARAILK